MSALVQPAKPHAPQAIFRRERALIGVIHSLPLPGSPAYDGISMAEIVAFAVAAGRHYAAGGLDGLIVENHGDIPFSKPDEIGPETADCMAVMTDAVRRDVGLPMGANVLDNDAETGPSQQRNAGSHRIRADL